jgi:hypothetical protein
VCDVALPIGEWGDVGSKNLGSGWFRIVGLFQLDIRIVFSCCNIGDI